jgi:cytochrome c
MTFDKHGDLWLQIGNNSLDHNKTGTGSHLSRSDSTASSEWGSSNTASMRGGTLRIHPDDSEKGYSIPSGNFGEYWAAEWAKRGNAALAAEYRNPAKVLPEVYIKGERSNFSINVHPTKRWMVWGTVSSGPNDKFSITANPIFSGWPYFQGNNARTDGHQEVLGFLVDPAAPRNTSPLKTGVVDLPPAVPGTINGLAGVAFSGPIYAFDPSLASDRKFPPHLNNAWFGWDWKFSPHSMWIFTLDSNDISKAPQRTRVDNGLFRGIPLRAPTQMKFGPDGSLYVLNYDGSYSTLNPGVVRVDYLGNCRIAVTSVNPKPAAPRPGPLFAITLSPAGLRVDEPGFHEMELYDLAGMRILSRAGKEGAYYSFRDLRPGGLEKSVHLVRVKTARGLFVRKVAL